MPQCPICKKSVAGDGTLVVHATMMHSREERKKHFSEERYNELFNIKEREREGHDLEDEQFGYESGW